MSSLKRAVLVVCSAAASFAWAQQPKLEPLPDVPPPPPGVVLDDAPEVVIVQKGQDKVEEYRVNGRLYMMKVTPAIGPAYYLVDEEGKGQWAKRDTIGPNVQPPRWVIFSW
ncbi:MAG: DUF2782 domain-containing protein [Zoogloea sp.]|uniref:DUF2782 domain-containing protein n=1 Tax=Zoogloea sp. TaxID=49181 RepID=UPI003F3FD38B